MTPGRPVRVSSVFVGIIAVLFDSLVGYWCWYQPVLHTSRDRFEVERHLPYLPGEQVPHHHTSPSSSVRVLVLYEGAWSPIGPNLASFRRLATKDFLRVRKCCQGRPGSPKVFWNMSWLIGLHTLGSVRACVRACVCVCVCVCVRACVCVCCDCSENICPLTTTRQCS